MGETNLKNWESQRNSVPLRPSIFLPQGMELWGSLFYSDQAKGKSIAQSDGEGKKKKKKNLLVMKTLQIYFLSDFSNLPYSGIACGPIWSIS